MIATLPLPSADPHPMRRSPEPADPDPNAAAAPSKTQRKRDSHELQHLGEALAALPDERLARLELPEGLADALREYRRTRSHEGRRRQLQYVGKLMRALGRDRQVLAVTHLPQVAACADHHYVVAKKRDKGGTSSSVTPTDATQREREIARMLGGEKISDTTMAHAREMLLQAAHTP